MIGIHPVHRRLAELQFKADRRGGYDRLTPQEQRDLQHCLQANAQLVRRLDELKNLSFAISTMRIPDADWQHEICKAIDELEVSLL